MHTDDWTPRVLQLDSGREWRGGQTQLLLLAQGWPGETMVALPPDAPVQGALRAAGVRTVPLSFRKPGDRWRLRALVRAFQPGLVAAQTSRAHGLALGCGRPLVVHRRLDFVPRRTSWLKYRFPAGYLAVSQAVHEVLRGAGIPEDRIAVVPDGVDPSPLEAAAPDPAGIRREMGWAADALVILAAGALVAHKGHRHLIEAVARGPASVCLLLCGEGPLEGRLRAHVARRGLGHRIRLLGHRRDLPRLLRSVDALVHPSVEEGMGQVVAEAMIAGTPVIATAAGGVPEVLQGAGWLVPVGDIDGLTRAMGQLAEDRGAARARATQAQPAARRRHDPAQMVASTRAAYLRFLGRS